jgi:hypothetical protein
MASYYYTKLKIINMDALGGGFKTRVANKQIVTILTLVSAGEPRKELKLSYFASNGTSEKQFPAASTAATVYDALHVNSEQRISARWEIFDLQLAKLGEKLHTVEELKLYKHQRIWHAYATKLFTSPTSEDWSEAAVKPYLAPGVPKINQDNAKPTTVNISQKRYTVTIHAAAPGTPLKEGGVSTPGHLFYTTSDGGTPKSFGFAPITHGDMYGPGKPYDNDVDNYQNPFYERTMEVTAEQYEKLNAFGYNPENYGFSLTYTGTNNCVDYTWRALRHAGINASTTHAKSLGWIRIKYEGRSVPLHNVDAIKSIPAPLPKSELNQEKTNPLPDIKLWQKLLTENKVPPSPNDGMPA